jgi:uncharacterized protein YkwD
VVRILSVLLTSLLTVVLLAVPGHAQARPTSPGDYLSQARAATNAERTNRQLRPLAGGPCLRQAAQRQAVRMANREKLFHTPDFDAIGRRCGLRAWGENVAQAPGGGAGRDVVRMWMGSSGHRANILNSGYRLLGMGAVKRRGSWWVVQVFGRSA